jgi:mRNA-degrading endonuclease RelE of RelBE toxin-antitoxin system
MSKVVLSRYFVRESKALYKRHRSLAADVVTLIGLLEDNPFQGTPLGKNCYKIRLKISSKNTGKSGGARVITHVHVEGDTVTLLSIYDKSEQADISDDEIATRLKEIL